MVSGGARRVRGGTTGGRRERHRVCKEAGFSPVKSVGLTVAFLLVVASGAGAEESSLEFFDRDAALTVFDDSVVVVKAGRIKTESPKEAAVPEKPTVTTEAKAKDGGSRFDPETATAADIVAEFGAPDEKLPVIAVESAPQPFKAMMRALEAGHDDLAFQYARQYVRYIGHVQAQNARLLSMTGKALEREGMIEPASWQGGPDFVEDRELLERDLARSGIAARSAELDARTRAVLAEAQVAESKADPRNRAGGTNSIVPSVHDDPRVQAQINGEREPPPATAPSFDVLFFFSPTDPTSIAVAPEIEALYRSGQKMNFVALTVGAAVPGEVQRYRSMTKTSFPIRSGATLAASMKLEATPTLVVVDNATGKSVSRSGRVTAAELKALFASLAPRGTP